MQKRSDTSLLVHMALIYSLQMMLVLLPGRILNMLAVIKSNLLRLKQIFVRYVSHEIRSPLNVVHVGLEMLLSIVKKADPSAPFITIDRSTADFIVQMFFSSESAINILNDLLQYEHIEAGTFHLSCDLLNIANVLENKFGWAHVMASLKGVIFSVRDTSISTEFGPIASTQMADDENGLSFQSNEVVHAQKQSFLYIDIYRIEQVIRNLITNAMKFTPSGGTVSVDISCELFSSGNGSHSTIRDKLAKDAVGYFRVAVTDSGAGLSVDEQNNLFGEFTQFNKNELQGVGGSGLGLWISRHIIDTHKGFIEVTSAGRGHGSTFYFTLPVYGPDFTPPQPLHSPPPAPQQQQQHLLLQPKPFHHGRLGLLSQSSVACEETEDRSHAYIAPPDSSTTSDAAQLNPPFVGTVGGGLHSLSESVVSYQEGATVPEVFQFEEPHPLRLLIVDDSSLNCKVVAKIIEGEKVGAFVNATILTADDGTTAMEQLRNELSAGRPVHFVLMDFIMTTMHGPAAARLMREELNYAGVIIGVTGSALPEDIESYISSGANQVITKPLSRAKLMDALNHFLPMAMAVEE